MDDLFYDSACTSDADIFVAAWTVLVELEPVFDATLAEQLITVVAFFGLPTYFEANLAQYKSSELFADFETTDAVGVITHMLEHFPII